MRPKKERAAPVAPSAAQIKTFNTERYAPDTGANQVQQNGAADLEDFLAKLERMADWFDSLMVRIGRRQDYLVLMNAWGGHDDLAMEVRDFNTACHDLIATFGKKRRAS